MTTGPIRQQSGTAVLHDGNGPRDDSQRGFADNPPAAFPVPTKKGLEARCGQLSKRWSVYPLNHMSDLALPAVLTFTSPVPYLEAYHRASVRWRLVDVEPAPEDEPHPSVLHERAKSGQLD